MKRLIILAALLSLGACASQTMQRDHGVSTANNMAVETVHPAAATEGSTADSMEGISADDAMQQYQKADNRNRGERLVRDLAD